MEHGPSRNFVYVSPRRINPVLVLTDTITFLRRLEHIPQKGKNFGVLFSFTSHIKSQISHRIVTEPIALHALIEYFSVSAGAKFKDIKCKVYQTHLCKVYGS